MLSTLFENFAAIQTTQPIHNNLDENTNYNDNDDIDDDDADDMTSEASRHTLRTATLAVFPTVP